jgi:hypothetical protein
MVRTQIMLTADQLVALREAAAREGRSMADLVRDGVDLVLNRQGWLSRDELKRRSLAALGAYRSGVRTLGTEHDAHLAEAFEQ